MCIRDSNGARDISLESCEWIHCTLFTLIPLFKFFFLVHVTLLQCFYNPLAYDKNYRIFKARVLPFCTCTHKWDLGYNRIQRTFVQFAQNWTPEISGCGYKAQHIIVTKPYTDLARSCSTDGCCAAGCVQLTAVVLHDLLP